MIKKIIKKALKVLHIISTVVNTLSIMLIFAFIGVTGNVLQNMTKNFYPWYFSPEGIELAPELYKVYEGARIEVATSILNKTNKKEVESMGNNLEYKFCICDNYVIDDGFPIIYIKKPKEDVYWIHFIRMRDKRFNISKNSISPFHIYNLDFYFHPAYNYELFGKPWKWVSHVYAVEKTPEGKWKPIGGLRWGYERAAYAKPFPVGISPTALTLDDWNRDLSDFKAILGEDFIKNTIN